MHTTLEVWKFELEARTCSAPASACQWLAGQSVTLAPEFETRQIPNQPTYDTRQGRYGIASTQMGVHGMWLGSFLLELQLRFSQEL
jgi:hypothetical protein